MSVPNMSEVVAKIGLTHKLNGTPENALEFCRKVVRQLRATRPPDEVSRWGLNYKRGKVGTPSVDIVAYKDPVEGTRIVDVIYAWDDPAKAKVGWGLVPIEKADTVLWFWDEEGLPAPLPLPTPTPTPVPAPLPLPPVPPPVPVPPAHPTYDQLINGDQADVRQLAAALTAYRGGWSETDLAHFLWGLLIDGRPLASILAEIRGGR